jgi:hypothetical protein
VPVIAFLGQIFATWATKKLENFAFLGVNLTKNELSFFGKISKFSKPQNWKK